LSSILGSLPASSAGEIFDPGGTISNDVSVVIADGVSKNEARIALQAITAAIVGDTVTLN
jgi:hypothetical protein